MIYIFRFNITADNQKATNITILEFTINFKKKNLLPPPLPQKDSSCLGCGCVHQLSPTPPEPTLHW